MDSLSLSNSVSKETRFENTEMSTAYFEDLKNRKNDAITNEQIQKDDIILDTYEVTSDAISGGMGSVWRVHHNSWNTDLAMKRPQPRFFAEGGDQKKAQFVAECENWINLGLHPNIVSCYYVREIGGVPTIFSEWMDGGSLSDRIKDGSLYEGTEAEIQERILDIAIQAARGLQYSHENGLIHQDFKPSNLLLTKEWDAKVADFGLAKAKSNLDEDSETAKTTGYTLAYCPQEQVDREEPQKWIDVYSWALTVLEMYAGKRLWQTGAEAKQHFDEYITQCVHKIPDEMQRLLKDCLTDKPDDFKIISEKSKKIIQTETGKYYSRKEIRKVNDTASTLNNRALSFLDIGQTDIALMLLQKTASTDSAVYNPAKWNLFLLCKRSGMDTDQIFPERDEEKYRYMSNVTVAAEITPERDEKKFYDMEIGDLVSVFEHQLICDKAEKRYEKDGDEEYQSQSLRLKELLDEHKDVYRRVDADAAWTANNKILLCNGRRWSKQAKEKHLTIELRLVDARTFEVIQEFEEAPMIDFVSELLEGQRRQYWINSPIETVFFNEKYAFVVKVSEYRFKHLLIHVWDVKTRRFLKVIEARDPDNCRFYSTDQGDKLYSKGYEFDIPAGTATPGNYEELLKDEISYDFSNGYRISLKTFPADSDGILTQMDVYFDGDLISSDKYKNVCVDYEQKKVMFQPERMRDFLCPRIWKFKRISYRAPYIISKIHTSLQATSEFDIVMNAVDSIPELLEQGRVEEALNLYEDVREQYWGIGYDKEIININPLFLGHAFPVGLDTVDRVPFSEYANYAYIPLNKEETVGDKEIWVKSYGNRYYDDFYEIPRVYCDREYEFLTNGEGYPENSVSVFDLNAIDANGDPESRYYELPDGLLQGVFAVNNQLLFQISKIQLLWTDYSVETGLRTNVRSEMLCTNACPISQVNEMYRLSLSDGKLEKIGEGYGSFGGISFSGLDIQKEKNIPYLPRYFGEYDGSRRLIAASISYDGRLIMFTDPRGGLLFAPSWKWEAPKGRNTKPFYTLHDPYEDNKNELKKEGVKLYERKKDIPVPRKYAALYKQQKMQEETKDIVEESSRLHKEINPSEKGKKKGFMKKLFGKK